MDQVLLRRIMGTASVLLLIAVTYAGMWLRYAPDADTYTVDAVLGRAGSGLSAGTDIKARGVRVGEVESLAYDDGIATAVLRLERDPALPAPDDLEMVVTAKTLLGEKQIELFFPDDRFGRAPFLEPGDTLVAAREPTELQEVLDQLEPFVDAIDGQDLATIVDALGAQQGEGERIAENIELSQRLASFGDRTAEANLDNLRALADIAEAMAPRARDLTRLNRALPEATRVLVERQMEIRRNLEALQRFSVGFAEFLEVEEPGMSRLLQTGDVIGAMLERQAPNIGILIDGLARYASGFKHGGDLDDGSEFAFFRILLSGDGLDPVKILCDNAANEGLEAPFGCPEEAAR